MPTANVAELGQRVKAKHPGAYDRIPDAELGTRYRAKHPAYSWVTDMPETAPDIAPAAATPEGPPAPTGAQRASDEYARAPGWVRVGRQVARGAYETLPVEARQLLERPEVSATLGAGPTLVRNVPEAQGAAEHIGRVAGGVAGLTAEAVALGPALKVLPVVGPVLAKAPAIRSGLAYGLPQGLATEGSAQRRVVTGVTTGAAGAAVSGIAAGAAAGFARQAPQMSQVAGAAASIGAGAVGFGAVEPLVRQAALASLGEDVQPITKDEIARNVGSMGLIGLIMGGHALVQGARAVGRGPAPHPAIGTLGPGPEGAAARRGMGAPVSPEEPAAPPAPPLRPSLMRLAEKNAAGLDDVTRNPLDGNRTAKAAFLQRFSDNLPADAEQATTAQIAAAVKKARGNTLWIGRLNTAVSPPPMPANTPPDIAERHIALSRNVSRELTATLTGKDIDLGAVTGQPGSPVTVVQANFFPWAEKPVRLLAIDRATNTPVPLFFDSVADLSSVAGTPMPEAFGLRAPGPQQVQGEGFTATTTPRAGVQPTQVPPGGAVTRYQPPTDPIRAAAGRAKLWSILGGPRGTEPPPLPRYAGTPALERETPEQATARKGQEAEMAKSADALRAQIAKHPGDKRGPKWKRRLARLDMQLGRGPATPVAPKPGAPPVERPSAPTAERGLGPGRAATVTPEIEGPAVQPASGKPVRESRPSPAPAPSEPAVAAERVLVPGMVFRSEEEGASVVAKLAAQQPGSEPRLVRTKQGWQLEVNPNAAVEKNPRFKKQDFRPNPAGGQANEGASLERAPAPAPAPATLDAEAPAPAPAPATLDAEASVPAPAGRPPDIGGIGKQGIAHPDHVDAAIGHIIGDTGARPELARMQREGATDEQLGATLEQAMGAGGGDSAARYEYGVGGRYEGPWISMANLPGIVGPEFLYGARLVARVRQGLDIPSPREAMERAGQADMFGGQAFLGGGNTQRAGGAVEGAAPAEIPTGEGEAAVVPEGRVRDVEVQTDEIRTNARFQKRNQTTRPENLRTLLERRGGFSMDEIRARPPILWYDSKGELGKPGYYLLDGHHRVALASSEWGKAVRANPETGATEPTWVRTGPANRKIPAKLFEGSLAEAENLARTANQSTIENTYTEKAKIVAELAAKGTDAKKIAAEMGVKPGAVKRLLDFHGLDPEVRARFFPDGAEDSRLGSTVHGEVVGALARKAPDLVTPTVQSEWLQAAISKNGGPGMSSAELRDVSSAWLDTMKLLKQDVMDLPGGNPVLLMPPKLFLDSVGRLEMRVTEVRGAVAAGRRAMEAARERAAAKGNVGAVKVFEQEAKELADEIGRLNTLRGSVRERMKKAVAAEARGQGSLEAEMDAIRKDVDSGLAAIPIPKRTGPPMGMFPGNIGQWMWESLMGQMERPTPENQRVRPLNYQGDAPPEAVKSLVDGLDAAVPIRGAQEAEYTAERGKRIRRAVRVGKAVPGEAGHHAQLREMAGAMKKLDFEALALDQKQRDALYDAIRASKRVTAFEQVSAQRGLSKLLLGRVPQAEEIEKLVRVFGDELAQALQRKAPMLPSGVASQVMNLTKSIQASGDISFGFRQGIGLISRPEWRRAFRNQFHYLKSEQAFRAGMTKIYNDPDYLLARKAALAITEPGTLISEREEQYISDLAERLGEIVERIPRIGPGLARASGAHLLSRVVRASNRAFTGMANDLRFGTFKNLVREARSIKPKGWNPATDASFLRDLGSAINDLTGRGDLGSLKKHAALLNAAFWSPALIASRVRLLNPIRYIGTFEKVKARAAEPPSFDNPQGTPAQKAGHRLRPLDPFVRRALIRSVIASGAVVTALTGLLATVAGVTVSALARDPDFGKFKIGNTRSDFGGGFLQYIRLGARLVYEIRHPESWDLIHNPGATLTSFAAQKTTPFLAFVWGLMTGRQAVGGKPFDPKSQLAKLFIPMALGDTWEAAREWGLLHPLTAAVYVGSSVGVGTQTYAPKPNPSAGLPRGQYDPIQRALERANRELVGAP
jgi:hypothetical protein